MDNKVLYNLRRYEYKKFSTGAAFSLELDRVVRASDVSQNAASRAVLRVGLAQ